MPSCYQAKRLSQSQLKYVASGEIACRQSILKWRLGCTTQAMFRWKGLSGHFRGDDHGIYAFKLKVELLFSDIVPRSRFCSRTTT